MASRFSRQSGAKNAYAKGEPANIHRSIFPRGSIWTWMIVTSLITIAFVMGSFAFTLLGSVSTVRAHASSVKTYAGEFLASAKSGDANKLKSSAQHVSDAAHAIKDELNTSIWEFTSRLPIVGSDVDDVRILSEVLADFSDTALIPMSESGKILSLSKFVHGSSIDATVLPDLLYAVEEARPALERSAAAMEELPPAHIGPIKSIVDEASETLQSANKVVTRLRPIFPYLSGLLGADGTPKKYLILAENTAEIHASGGFVGSFAIMTVDNGNIEIGKFKNLAEVLSYGENPAGATAEEIETFGEGCDREHGDHNLIPDFQRVGQLYANIWSFYQDLEVDGVFGLDPVFLQYLLNVLGPVETESGVKVDGTNAAAVLLNQSLFWWSPTKCDGFYREVANKTMSRLFDDLDDLDMTAFFQAVLRASDEGRCLLWVRDQIIEEALKEAGIAGQLLHDPTSPQLGVYISDRSVSKESFYLSMDTDVSEPWTNEDGSSTYRVRVTIKNNMNPSLYDSIPGYIKVQNVGRDDLDLTELFHIIAPEGGSVSNIQKERVNTQGAEPEDGDWKETYYQGLQVQTIVLRFEPQESAIVSFEVTTSPEIQNEMTVRTTPLMPPEYAYWDKAMKEEDL